jgi:hypothetical protein
MNLEKIVNFVNGINHLLNVPSDKVSDYIYSFVRFIGRKTDYKLAHPIRSFLGLYIVGPIAGILRGFRWAEQLTMGIALYNLIPLGLPLLSLVALTLGYGALMGLARSALGIVFNNIYKPSYPHLDNYIRTPLSLGVEAGMQYANALTKKEIKTPIGSHHGNYSITTELLYSQEFMRDALYSAQTGNIGAILPNRFFK